MRSEINEHVFNKRAGGFPLKTFEERSSEVGGVRPAPQIVINLLLFVAITAWVGVFAPLEIDPHHDGIVIKPALDVANGAVPFRDTFSQYGILTLWLQALAMIIAGKTLLVLRYTAAIAYGLSGVFFWNVWRRLLSPGLALFAVFVWIALAEFYQWPLLAWSSIYCLTFQAAGLLCLFVYYESGRKWIAAAGAGACAAAMFWCRQPVGLLNVMALLCAVITYDVLFADEWKGSLSKACRSLALVTAGFLVPSVAITIWLVSVGALDDWYLQSIKMAAVFGQNLPYYWYGNQNSALFLILNSLFVTDLGLTWLILPMTTLAFAVIATLSHFLAYKIEARQKLAMCLAIVCIASWAQYYPVTEDRHVFWSASPMVGLFIFFIDQFFKMTYWPRPITVASVVFVTALAFGSEISSRAHAAITRLKTFDTTLKAPAVLSGMRTTADDANMYQAMSRDLETLEKKYPERPIVNIGYDALYLTMIPQPNWHPMYVYFDIGLEVYPDFATRLKDYIRRRRPILITPGSVDWGDGYRSYGNYANGISFNEPADGDTSGLLGGMSDVAPVLQHIAMTQWLYALNPMQQTGQRLPPVALKDEFSMEFLIHPYADQSNEAVIFANMFGPVHGRGLVLLREPDTNEYVLRIGTGRDAKGFRTDAVVSFHLPPDRTNYVVINRRGSLWQAWVDGALVSHGTNNGAIGADSNTVFLGNGLSRAQLFSGMVPEYRITSMPIPDALIRSKSASIHRQIDHIDVSVH